MLNAMIAEHAVGRTLTRTELEERFLALCRAADLPLPELNAYVVLDGGFAPQVDFVWRAQRLVVETDSRAFHGTRAFEEDRRRDQRLMLGGWRVMRCTWRQVLTEPVELARTVRSLLAAAKNA